MKKTLFILAFLACRFLSLSQDTTQTTHWETGGYLDVYQGFDFSGFKGTRPYAYSSAQIKDIAMNLGMVYLKYSDNNFRLNLSPAYGTYMMDNYAAEPSGLRFIYEANAGVRLYDDLWLDVGVMPSPFTYENALSKDQLCYIRSLASENTPYYLAGAKLSYKFSKKLNVAIWLVNGWQQIADPNTNKSVVASAEYAPNDKWAINGSFYAGEDPVISSNEGLRTLLDINTTFTPNDKWKFSAGISSGTNSAWGDNISWGQANLSCRYHLGKKWYLNGRYEYFNDPKYNVGGGFFMSDLNIHGLTFGISKLMYDKVLLRIENRSTFSSNEVFPGNRGNERSNHLLMLSLTGAFGKKF